MANKPAVSKAVLNRAINVLQDRGLPFAGLRCRPDGTIDVLVGLPNDAATSADGTLEALEGGWEAYDRDLAAQVTPAAGPPPRRTSTRARRG